MANRVHRLDNGLEMSVLSGGEGYSGEFTSEVAFFAPGGSKGVENLEFSDATCARFSGGVYGWVPNDQVAAYLAVHEAN